MTETELIRRVTLDDLKSITSKMKTSFYGAPVSSVRRESGDQGDEVIKISTTLNGINTITGYIQITGVTTNSIIDSKVIVNKGQLYIVNGGQIISSCVLIPIDGSCFYIKFDNQENTAFQIKECTVTAALLNEGEPLYKVITAVEINPEAPTFDQYVQVGTSPYDLDKFPNYSEEGIYQPTNNPTSFCVETGPNKFAVYPDTTVFNTIKRATTAHELDHKVTFTVQQVDDPTGTATDFSDDEIVLQVPTMMEGKYLPLSGGTLTGTVNFEDCGLTAFDANHDLEVNLTPELISLNNFVTGESIELKEGTVLASRFKTPTGTSTQFLKADGSVDSNSYALKSELSNLVTQIDEVGAYAEEKCQEVLDHSDEEDKKLKILIEEKTKQYNTIESISQLLTKHSTEPVAPSTLYTGEVINLYNIQENVTGLQFKFADINSFGQNDPVEGGLGYAVWDFTGNSQVLYIGLARLKSVHVACRYEVVVTSNDITTTHILGAILDTPNTTTGAAAGCAEVSTMPFTIVTRKESDATNMNQYIKIPAGFVGTIKIRLVKMSEASTVDALSRMWFINSETDLNGSVNTTTILYTSITAGTERQMNALPSIPSTEVPTSSYMKDKVVVDSIYDCSDFTLGSSVPDQILNYLLLYNLKLKTNGN